MPTGPHVHIWAGATVMHPMGNIIFPGLLTERWVGEGSAIIPVEY